MTAIERTALTDDLASRAFYTPPGTPAAAPLLGAEVELIPIDRATRHPCWTLSFLRRYGALAGWEERQTSKGSPSFLPPEGGVLTFEPGGQVEFSTPPMPSASQLLRLLRRVVVPLSAAAAEHGLELLAVGIDPFNPIERSPLVIGGSRYQRMADYFASRHPAGARMMRQTAAFQISIDTGTVPWPRWRVLNAAAPYFVAMFANSPCYAGALTASQSERAEVWRMLDPARTGLPYDACRPIEAYLDFALAAPAIFLPTARGRYRPFGEWLEIDGVTARDWDDHLSTLFPEVRPRGRLEIRSMDSIPPEWFAAPVALAVGITYAPRALRAALDLLAAPDPYLLRRAGRQGVHDPAIARVAVDLVDIALQGCRALGPAYLAPDDLERAGAFFDRYTRRGRSLADDRIDAAAAA